MRSNAMLKSIRDIVFILLFVGIGLLAYFKMDYFIKHPFNYGNGNIWTIIMCIIYFYAIAYFSINALASLGASILFGNSYDANKEIYKMSFHIYDDKLNGMLFAFKVCLLGTVGMMVLPFAFLYTLFNLRKLFESNNTFEEKEKAEREYIIQQNENDITLKTSAKKWCVKDNSGISPTYYYFHKRIDAAKFALLNGHEQPTKKLF